MARPRNYTFISESILGDHTELDSKGVATATISRTGVLRFSKLAVEKFGLVDGRFLKLFVTPDGERIGWSIFSKGELNEMSHLHEIKRYEIMNGKYPCPSYRIAVGRFLRKAGIKNTGTFKALPIEVYKSITEDRTIYHINLFPKVPEIENTDTTVETTDTDILEEDEQNNDDLGD